MLQIFHTTCLPEFISAGQKSSPPFTGFQIGTITEAENNGADQLYVLKCGLHLKLKSLADFVN